MGRRWGKSVFGGVTGLSVAYYGGLVAWVAPSYKQSRPLWRFATQHVAPLVAAKAAQVSRSDLVISFPGAGDLMIFTAENIDAMRGYAFDLIIPDEAAMYAEEAWTDVMQPTLADRGGRALLITTPRGRNWVWREWLRGRNGEPGYHSFQAPSSANPNPLIRAAFEKARHRVSDRTFRQEWLAEFVDDSGAVFRNIEGCSTAPWPVEVYPSTFVMGVDWGQDNDFTVLTVMDAATGAVVDWARFNGISWLSQRERLAAMARKWNVTSIMAEKNSIGGPNIEELQNAGLPVQAFTTTNATKSAIIDHLVILFEHGNIAIPHHDDLTVMRDELRNFEVSKTPSGLIKYGAPPSQHDDAVMSLALAAEAARVGTAMNDYLATLTRQNEERRTHQHGRAI